MAKTIVIDAGHGGRFPTGDSGACAGGYREADANLTIAKKIGKILKDRGYKVIYTRTKDKSVTLAKRCKISNENDADFFISIHLNASTNKSANGVETLRYPKVGKRTKDLANNIQAELVRATGFRDRGVKQRDDLYVLKKTNASACLIECGFISCPTEREKLFTEFWQNKIADAICKGIAKTTS